MSLQQSPFVYMGKCSPTVQDAYALAAVLQQNTDVENVTVDSLIIE